MPSLNIFIDGSWLYSQCGAGGTLANTTESPDSRFPFSFSRLDDVLLKHVREHSPTCRDLSEKYFVTSVFTLPADFDEWPNHFDEVTQEQVDKMKRSVRARDLFAKSAVAAGYKPDAIFRPPIKHWILKRFADRSYQEKQVDTSVVALLVRSAITKPNDHHVLITGDSDTLPAIRVAFPEYTRNVLIATTHPDELKAAHRQTSFSLLDFKFEVPPVFFQNCAENLIDGVIVHKCAECGKVFVLAKPLPKNARPYCRAHRLIRASR